MPDSRIPSLAPFGLDRVPGYRVDRKTGFEDVLWRKEYFDWYGNARDWRLWAQQKFGTDSQFREDILTLCQRDCALFNLLFMDIEEPRAIAFFDEEGHTLEDALAGLNDDTYELSVDDLSYRTIHPYIPFSYQIEAWRTLTYVILGPLRGYHFDVLWDKARGIGMSYAFLAWA